MTKAHIIYKKHINKHAVKWYKHNYKTIKSLNKNWKYKTLNKKLIH